MVTIYAISNEVTGFVYVGCTARALSKRLKEHKKALRDGTQLSTKMLADFRTHGQNSFKASVLETFPESSSVVTKRVRELYWMQVHADHLYNHTQTSFRPSEQAFDAAHAAVRGRVRPQEERDRISKAQIGKFVSDETRAKLRAVVKAPLTDAQKAGLAMGRTHVLTPEQIAHRSKVRTGEKRSPETKQKLRDAWVRRKARTPRIG